MGGAGMPFIKSNGIQIHYEEFGTGEPLILIMGLGADGSKWDENIQVYQKSFRCIRIDNRGSGASDKPSGEAYTTREMALDTLGVMNALGLEKAHVSGISMGGAIAQELSIMVPDRVISLTLVSTFARARAHLKRANAVQAEIYGKVSPETFIRLSQLLIYSDTYHETRMDDLIRRERMDLASPHPMPDYAFRAQCQACIDHDALSRLDRITAPTLIVAGEKDFLTPPYYSEELAQYIKNSRLYVIRKGGHTHHWEMLDEFNDVTMKFMLEHTSAASTTEG